MVEVFALVIYSVQWLGVVLGVGAEVVLLVAHLIALHHRQPQWIESVPAVRAAQFIGLLLIVASGVAAVVYQFLIGDTAPLFMAVFGFKWALIIALSVAYMLEKNLLRGHAVLEGFTGATWLALFLVHSVAPISPWLDLILFYTAWIIAFGVVWGSFVLLMKYTGKGSITAPAAKLPDQKVPGFTRPAEKPQARPDHFAQKVSPPPPPPVPKPVPPPPPPTPIVVSAPPPPPPAPKPTPPPVPSIALAKEGPAPVLASKPINLPVIEPLELAAPRVTQAAKPAVARYAPDYDHMPGLRVMPQRVEDLHLQNRGPVVQAA